MVALDERGEVRLVGRDATEAPLLGVDEQFGEDALGVGLAVAVGEVGGRHLQRREGVARRRDLHLRRVQIGLAAALQQAERDERAIPVGRGSGDGRAQILQAPAERLLAVEAHAEELEQRLLVGSGRRVRELAQLLDDAGRDFVGDVAEQPAAHRLRNLPLERLAAGRARELAGQRGDGVRVGRLGVDEERDVAPARVDGEEAREAEAVRVGQLHGVDLGHLVGAQAEEVEVELAHAEAPVAPAQQPRVERVKILVERPVAEFRAGRAAEVGRPAGERPREEAAGARARVEPMVRPRQPPEAFDEHHVPARHGAHKRVEQIGCPAPAAELDGVRHVHPPRPSVLDRDGPRADEVADVGHGPVVGHLDVLVFPKAVNRAAAARGLGSDQLDDAAQDAGIRGQPVLVAVDLRHELPQLCGVVALEAVQDFVAVTHERTTSWSSLFTVGVRCQRGSRPSPSRRPAL